LARKKKSNHNPTIRVGGQELVAGLGQVGRRLKGRGRRGLRGKKKKKKYKRRVAEENEALRTDCDFPVS